MAITIETQYAKRLGLPGYSSHQYSVTVRTEVGDLSQIEAESEKLYRLLQDSVDHEIQHSGFIGEKSGTPTNGHNHDGSDAWACTDRQQGLLLKLVADHNLDKQEVEKLAAEWQRVPVKAMNKLQMSSFLSDLIDFYNLKGPKRPTRPLNGSRRH